MGNIRSVFTLTPNYNRFRRYQNEDFRHKYRNNGYYHFLSSQIALGFPINNTTDYEAWVGGHTTYGENHTRVKPHKFSSMQEAEKEAY